MTTQQGRGTTGGNWDYGWGESKSLKSLNNVEGPFGNARFWVGNIGYVTAKIT